MFFLKKICLISIKSYQIKADNHNFDDILCCRNEFTKRFLHSSQKNYESNRITFDNTKVCFNGQEIILKQNAINIIVTKNSHNLLNRILKKKF